MPLESGQLIDDRYRLTEKLGEGGMGVVWKAEDHRVGDDVVIKTPLAVGNPEILKRFGAEAKAMRRYSAGNPNILDIQDIGQIDGMPYYAMRYLPGGSLRDRCPPVGSTAQPTNDDASLAWLPTIARALDFLHSKGTVHRDVKPENVLFNECGDAYLVDFGIVKSPSDATTMTQADHSPGTLAYMPMEVLMGQTTVDGKIDQYALAVTLYETLTGIRPHSGATSVAVYESIRSGHTPLHQVHPEVSEPASAVMDRALSSEPEKRFGSCVEFADAFCHAIAEPSPKPADPTVKPAEVSVPQSMPVSLLQTATTAEKRNGGDQREKLPWWTRVVRAIVAALAGILSGWLAGFSMMIWNENLLPDIESDFPEIMIATIALLLIPGVAFWSLKGSRGRVWLTLAGSLFGTLVLALVIPFSRGPDDFLKTMPATVLGCLGAFAFPRLLKHWYSDKTEKIELALTKRLVTNILALVAVSLVTIAMAALLSGTSIYRDAPWVFALPLAIYLLFLGGYQVIARRRAR